MFCNRNTDYNDKNIDQQYFEKAFSNPSKADEESVASLMQLQLENEDKNGVPEDMEILSWVQDIVWEQSEESEKSQLNQGASLICSWESQDQMNDSRETDCRDKDTQSKLVKTTSHDLVCEEHLSESDSQPQLSGKVVVEEYKNFAVGQNAESDVYHFLQNKSGVKSSPSVAEHSIQGSDVNHSAGLKVKKTKVIRLKNAKF